MLELQPEYVKMITKNITTYQKLHILQHREGHTHIIIAYETAVRIYLVFFEGLIVTLKRYVIFSEKSNVPTITVSNVQMFFKCFFFLVQWIDPRSSTLNYIPHLFKIFYFETRVSLSCLGWTGTCDLPA